MAVIELDTGIEIIVFPKTWKMFKGQLEAIALSKEPITVDCQDDGQTIVMNHLVEDTHVSYNSEFRHNPNDDIEVIEPYQDKLFCEVCGEYKPNVVMIWAGDSNIITACPDCCKGDKPLVQNFDDTESNMPH